jgi:hypothetical protein
MGKNSEIELNAGKMIKQLKNREKSEETEKKVGELGSEGSLRIKGNKIYFQSPEIRLIDNYN